MRGWRDEGLHIADIVIETLDVGGDKRRCSFIWTDIDSTEYLSFNYPLVDVCSVLRLTLNTHTHTRRLDISSRLINFPDD